MSTGPDELPADRIRETITNADRSTVETGVRVVAALLLVTIAIVGGNQDVLVLWLVPVALALLVIDPPRTRDR